jgi:5-methylcytosine-specific restriction endonuclease McrA
MSAKHQRMLAVVATDRTFERTVLDGASVWVGKCIHCNAKLVVTQAGRPAGNATLEHIVPESRGGTNEVGNLAIACARCNREKSPHDVAGGEKLQAMQERLLARRNDRWRDPAEAGLKILLD